MARQTIACGDCFRWAGKYIIDHPNDTLVHGTVKAVFNNERRYPHAWVETDTNRVLDWQSIVAGYGGNFVIPGQGYNIDDFYELYTPKKITPYTSREAIRAMVSNSHWGPWK